MRLFGVVNGQDNKIIISKFSRGVNINLNINGNNIIFIDDSNYAICNLKIQIGNTYPANNTKLLIGKKLHMVGADFFLYNPMNQLYIGDSCMFSNSVKITCGEMLHFIFDKNSGQYIDVTNGVRIGNHTWVGEGVYITKRAKIPNG